MKIETKSEQLNRLINRLCDSEEQKNPFCKLYRGSIHNVNIYGESGDWWNLIQKVNITETIEGGDNYNQTYGSTELLTTANYCEGDLVFTVHSNLESYKNEVTETEKWYRENY